jgi:hypothetical protein
MVIAYEEEVVRQYMREAATFSQSRPVLIDRFLEDATEVDVDALCDGEDVLIAGHHGAYRRGRSALRGQFLCVAARRAGSRRYRHNQELYAKARSRVEGHRLDECAVCHQGWKRVCA